MLVSPLLDGAWMVVFWAVGGMIVGINFGINQWFLLRPLSPETLGGRANWWVAATVVGWAVSLAIVIGTGTGARIGFPLIGALIGLAVGIPQTFVIASGVSRGWLWLIGHSIAWIVSLSLIPLVGQALGFALAGVISGAIGGGALIRIIGGELADNA
jgi:hypothetical protein